MKKSIFAKVIGDPVPFGIQGIPTWDGCCPPMLRRSPLVPGLMGDGNFVVSSFIFCSFDWEKT
jgi:hypothetical protein